MELKLTVEQFAKINEMGLTVEQVQEVVNLVIPEDPEQEAPEPVNIPDYSDSFKAISAKLESLQEQISKASIINSGAKESTDAESSVVEFLNQHI